MTYWSTDSFVDHTISALNLSVGDMSSTLQPDRGSTVSNGKAIFLNILFISLSFKMSDSIRYCMYSAEDNIRCSVPDFQDQDT